MKEGDDDDAENEGNDDEGGGDDDGGADSNLWRSCCLLRKAWHKASSVRCSLSAKESINHPLVTHPSPTGHPPATIIQPFLTNPLKPPPQTNTHQ